MRVLTCLFIGLFLSFSAAAQDNAPKISEHDIEERARDIGHALRCVVCQNQSIEESDASLAEDMRILVRARVKSGDSNAEVIAYMQDRYGDFVLLKPPVQPSTYILWFGPFILILLGGLWFTRQSRKTPDAAASSPLSQDELSRLEGLNGRKENAP